MLFNGVLPLNNIYACWFLWLMRRLYFSWSCVCDGRIVCINNAAL